jgi:protease I
MTKDIAMIIAPHRYHDIEFNVPYNYFLNQGASVDVYSTKLGLANSSNANFFEVHNKLSSLNVENYNAIVYVGGAGTWYLRIDDHALQIARDTIDHNKLLAAICWSVTVPAKAGVLNGRFATSFSGIDFETKRPVSEYISDYGAKYTGEFVTIDDNIITACGPEAAEAYAKTIIERLGTYYAKDGKPNYRPKPSTPSKVKVGEYGLCATMLL